MLMGRITIQEERSEGLRSALEQAGLLGAVIAPGPNMKYLTGVDSLMLERPFLLLIPVVGETQLLAPRLEAGPYRRAPLRLEIHEWTDSEGPGMAVSKAAKGAGLHGKWGIEGRVPYQYLDWLMKKARFRARDAEPVLQRLRETKDPSEASLLKKSGSILSEAFNEFPGLLREGEMELDFAKEATDVIREKGATKVDDMLVQSGPGSADPHHLPSTRKMQHGESVVVDVCAAFKGYYADMTRTFCIGSSSEVEKVYDVVLEAENAALGLAAPGVKVGDVDSAAREVMKKAGMGKYFFHRTGHGLGLEIHEAPYIVEGGREVLGPNMCFTIEPGAYFARKLGVRIEDDVLVKGKSARAITDTPKEFGWWK